jgi:hybrid cluster-associated redox disulfide protein
MKKIIKDMTIQEIFYKFPEKTDDLAQILMQSGLGCLGCASAQFETIEQGLQAHGKSQEEISQILSDLNSVISDNN